MTTLFVEAPPNIIFELMHCLCRCTQAKQAVRLSLAFCSLHLWMSFLRISPEDWKDSWMLEHCPLVSRLYCHLLYMERIKLEVPHIHCPCFYITIDDKSSNFVPWARCFGYI